MAIGDDGDISVVGGSIVRVRGKDAIAQDVACRLRYVRGEWYQNRKGGTPYYEQIFADDADDNIRRAVLGRVIRETPGVATLDRLTFRPDPTTRSLFVDGEGTTVDGDTFILENVELEL